MENVVMSQTENSKIINSGLGWLLNSGIQSMDEVTKGGFFAWYDSDEDSYPFVYTEITGYALKLLLNFSAPPSRSLSKFPKICGWTCQCNVLYPDERGR